MSTRQNVLFALLTISFFIGCQGKVDNKITEGYHLYQNNQHDKALKIVDSIIKMEKKNASAYILKGKIYINQKKPGKALKAFKKAVDIDKKNAIAYHGIASVYILKKDYDKAIEYLEQSITVLPKYFFGYYDLACMYSLKKDKRKAIDAFERFVEFYNFYKTRSQDDKFDKMNMKDHIKKDPDLNFIRKEKNLWDLS